MASATERFLLRKPATTDVVDVGLDLNANLDRIDLALGDTPCNAGTRPSSPAVGQTIYELDTRRTYVRTTSVWQQTAGPEAPTTLVDASPVAVNSVAGRLYRLSATADRTLAVPSNPVDGATLIVEVTAIGAARTITLTTGVAGGFKFGSDITGLTVTPSGTTDYIEAIYHVGKDRWLVLAYVKGY